MLCEYPSLSKEELNAWVGEKLGEDAALSSATLPSHSPISSWNSSTATPETTSTASVLVGLVGSLVTGGDPKTDHASSMSASSVREKGGDPKTVQASLVGSLVKETGGDPKTDLASFSAQMAATCSPYRPGLSTQTATVSTSPVLVPVVSPISAHGSEVRDGFPSFQQVPEHCDEFPCIPETSEDRDGFPSFQQDPEHCDEFSCIPETSGFSRSGGVVDHAHLGETFTNSSSDAEPSFSRVFRDDEKFEGVRQSDSGVQNLPASVSSSELSAHQMSGALAAKAQITSIEPTGLEAGGSDGCPLFGLMSGITDAVESAEEIPSEQCGGSGTTAIMEDVTSEFLTISDRALLRRCGQTDTGQKSINSIDVSRSQGSTTGSRVDGHPPNLSTNILDRVLLRRFPDIPPSLSSSSGSAVVLASPPCRGVEETTKKRKRFIGKGNAKKVNISQNSCDSLRNEIAPKLAESAVHSSILPTPLVLDAVPPGFALLYYTLVKDDALPVGYSREFLSLEKPARHAAKRSQISAASITDSMASTALSALRREADRRATEIGTIRDQLVIAADMRPKKFRTKWQRAVYDGPTARKDAEAAERDRWIQLLANLLRSTDTPMGKPIRDSPSNIQLLGGGRRAGTLRSRVRSVQKFLGWLIASHGISFPVHWWQLTEYLQVRYSEPCVRGSLKLVHSSYIFLQEVAGVEVKLTDSAMYAVSLKELMSRASPGSQPRQAPRFTTILLAAFEETVLSADKPVFVLLVQSWGTLRFDDHRGLLPRDVILSATGLQARLTRSKVSGSDKHLNFRTVIIHSSAYVQCKDWLAVGWDLLLKGAPHERDYLLPAPSNNFRGFKTKELKYPTAFAVQTHILSTACYRGLRVFEGSTGHYYTPHSGRNFMPSAAAVLGFSKSERDILGGWSAEGSQRYTRTAKYKIEQMQTAVASTFRNSEPDQLAEADDIDSLGDFLRTWEVPEDSVRRSQKILCLRSYTDLDRSISLNLFPSTLILSPVSWLWTIMTKKLNCRTNCQKRSSNQVTEVDPNFLVRITNKLVQNFDQSCRRVTTYRTRGRRPSGWYIAWDVATCCLESIIYLSLTLACSSQLLMTTIQYASGVRKLQNPRQIRGLQVRTRHRLPTSEITS